MFILEQNHALDGSNLQKNVRQLTLAFCGEDESCMLTLTVSEHADEGRVAAIFQGHSSYPKGDMRVPPAFLLHLQLLHCQITVLRRGETQQDLAYTHLRALSMAKPASSQ